MLFAALAAVLWSKLNFEERLLLEAFPDYAAYRTQSWRLIPPLY
jgi:protein-S-isoprenylcysteine O-methyltransferase Ste14